MNIYLISQVENQGYDTYDSAIVCAHDEKDAQSIHPHSRDGSWYESEYSPWATKKENVSVKYIGIACPSMSRGIVLASFNAG
jgi:hypothetical protein